MTREGRARGLTALLWLLGVGCTSPQREEPAEGTGDGGVALDSTAGTSMSGLDDGDDGGGSGIKFDTPGGAEGSDPDSTSGCDKVDFLFVIDNSGSMEDEQKNLVASFPGFIDTISSTLMAQDYHLMVVDSDAAGIEVCQTLCQALPSASCNGVPCSEIDFEGGDCAQTLGAGKTSDRSGGDCAVAGDRRYIVDGQPDLEGTFACVAEVGTTGSGDEQQISAMLNALEPSMNGSGGCNEGFLRDDAILVVTLITDEEDGAAGPDAQGETPSPGGPDDWRARLVELKLGDEQAVVVLGLIGDQDVAGGICGPLDAQLGTGAEPSPRLRTFVESFSQHVVGSVCEPDYAPFFESAVSVIDTACDGFEPQG